MLFWTDWNTTSLPSKKAMRSSRTYSRKEGGMVDSWDLENGFFVCSWVMRMEVSLSLAYAVDQLCAVGMGRAEETVLVRERVTNSGGEWM